MKNLLIASAICLSVCLVWPGQAQAADWTIENFQSDITVNADGTVSIIETIDVDFGNTSKHGIYRDIPYRYSDGTKVTSTELSVNSVSQDGTEATYETSQNENDIRVQIGDPGLTITGPRQYTIHYTAAGILSSFTDYDELYWNVTGDQWEVPIKQARATVRLPADGILQIACYEGSTGSSERCTTDLTTESQVTFKSSRELMIGEGLTIAVGYTKGLVPILLVATPPDPIDALVSPVALASSIVIFILGVIWVIRRWLAGGRDRSSGKTTIVAEYDAPASLRPAEIGLLVDERADTLDVSATIVDLAVRGYLTITEEPKKWLFGETDYIFNRTDKELSNLLRYEQKLLEKIFKKKTEVRLSALSKDFVFDLYEVKKLLYIEVTEKGLFVSNPDHIRNKQILFGIMFFVIGIVAMWLVGSQSQVFPVTILQLLLGSGLGLVPLGLTLITTAWSMPARTQKGSELYRQAKGFELFINTAEKYRAQFAEQENRYTEILPYAIVFRSTKKLAKAMEKLELTPPQPVWYVSPHPFHTVAFASTVSNFSSSLSQAMAATPGGSGSGGGGFSGGGFGGGGGGSW